MKTHIMILCFVVAAAIACVGNVTPQKEAELPAEQPAIKIHVGPGKDLEVTIQNIAKDDLAEIISTFICKTDERAKSNFNATLGKASALTLVLTTKTP